MRSDPSIVRSLISVLVIIGFSLAVAEFKVDTPEAPVTAIYGQYTVLRCSFTVQDESSLERLVIGWQHVETEEVVYSYYYGKEQLSRQSPQYSGRTSLFPEQLKQGNASLKLDRVRPADAGQYQCFVSNTKGNDQSTMSLIFTAYYKEPDFFIQLRPSGTVFRFESQGYPKASVSWYNEENEDISRLTETSYRQSGDGLYLLQSILEIHDHNRSSNYTFRLRNDVLHQSVSRTFGLTEMKTAEVHTRNRWMLVVFLLVTEFIIILILGTVLYKKHVDWKIKKDKMETTFS
ncbi:CD276 antigen-like [Heterodontus francisci]|uniref:CD276 antigen-like n=1 Tax=Heterodontus francisci TaxID=7792 RepID=UPI00355B8673